ncbi:peptidase M24, structural domain-containing protein [Pilobolus umbonatus]|nr:peptidase M24, structural domain-containing protein [Pilobolus umbonatus]
MYIIQRRTLSQYTLNKCCHFHSNTIVHYPPRSSNINNRFGTFQRIVPPSLSSVDMSQMPRRPVPENIMKPHYAMDGTSSPWHNDIPFNTIQDIEGMRKAGQLARNILQLGSTMCKPGITTNTIDEAIHNAIISNNAYPSPLNYMGFPKSLCTSINNIIAHGIPDDRPLHNGDIINLDVTVYLNGYHGDTSATFMIGTVDDKGKALIECTKETLDKAISICGPGVPYKEIGRVICEHAEKHGFSVSDELSGHGIGSEFHCLPLILHHMNEEEGTMTTGTAFTIEPILCEGSATGVMWPDNWTISTIDGGRSAQFEHTMIVTEDGVEIFT